MDRDALFFEDGTFAAPLHVANIEDVPDTHRDWYVETGKGGKKAFRLVEHIWKELREPFEHQVAELERQRTEMIAANSTNLDRERALRKAERINTALSAALRSAGVSAGLVAGATALLSDSNSFEVDATYDGAGVIIMAQTQTGMHSIDGLVEAFLESDEGAAFAPKRTVPNDAYFASLIAGLKQRR